MLNYIQQLVAKLTFVCLLFGAGQYSTVQWVHHYEQSLYTVIHCLYKILIIGSLKNQSNAVPDEMKFVSVV